jgi:hypothetical protein
VIAGAESKPHIGDDPTMQTAQLDGRPTRRPAGQHARACAKRWYSTKCAYLLAIFAILTISAAMAVSFGFLTVDSWNYLTLAQSIRHGEGCTVGGSYFATFPCGYPLAIALTAPSADIGSLMVSSKFTNLVLLFISFLLLTRTFRHWLVPTFVILNPFTIELSQYTWSENLFLLAFCGSMFALSRVRRGAMPYRALALLAFFLIVGISSRYVFAPFSAIVFVCAGLAYGWRTAVRALPAFVVAAIFFVAYQKLNADLTGFGTGIVRIPAPETVPFLTFRFFRQLAKEGVYLGVSALALLWLARKYWSSQPEEQTQHDSDVPESRLLMFAGAGFLLLAFYLRLGTQYEIYSPRTVSYGLTFIVAGLIGSLTRGPTRCFPAGPVLLYGILAVLAAQAEVLPTLLGNVLANGYVFPVHALQRYHSRAKDADLIVTLQLPAVAPTVDGYERLFYPKHAVLVNIHFAPYGTPDTVAMLRKAIATKKAHACVIDFTQFASREDLERYVNQSFPVALSLGAVGGLPVVVSRPSFDASMRDYLLGIFRPGQYVACPS